MAKLSPFDYLNSINFTKNHLMHDSENEDAEKDYLPFLVNRGLSYFQDTALLANEMNLHGGLDKRLQYDFLFHVIRKRKRFSKWAKKERSEDVEVLMEYYDYSTSKAEEALRSLNQEQMDEIKRRAFKGGR